MLQVLIVVIYGLFSAAVAFGGVDDASQPAAPKPIAPMPVTNDAQVRYTRAADYSEENGGRAVLIMIGGKTVFERYDNGWSAQKPHPLASGTKSFVGVVAAAAVEDGLLTWDELASDTLTEWKSDPRKCKITVRHLLTLSSGLDPSDALLGGRGGSKLLGQGAADRARRLGSQDKAPDDLFDAALDVPMKHDPGTKFEYGPSHFYAFGELLQRKLAAKHAADPKFPDTTFESYMHRRVLDPIGLKVGWFAEDKAGNPNLPGGCLLTASEWVKFGEMVRLQGKWPQADGTLKSVVSWETLAECFKPSAMNKDYGLTWWLPASANPEASLVADGVLGELLRRRNESQPARRMVGPDGEPLKVLMAAGLGKQRLYVIPAYDLVVVRFAEATREGRRYDDREFLAPILGVTAQGEDASRK